jgi:hypothetical protein
MLHRNIIMDAKTGTIFSDIDGILKPRGYTKKYAEAII